MKQPHKRKTLSCQHSKSVHWRHCRCWVCCLFLLECLYSCFAASLKFLVVSASCLDGQKQSVRSNRVRARCWFGNRRPLVWLPSFTCSVAVAIAFQLSAWGNDSSDSSCKACCRGPAGNPCLTISTSENGTAAVGGAFCAAYGGAAFGGADGANFGGVTSMALLWRRWSATLGGAGFSGSVGAAFGAAGTACSSAAIGFGAAFGE